MALCWAFINHTHFVYSDGKQLMPPHSSVDCGLDDWMFIYSYRQGKQNKQTIKQVWRWCASGKDVTRAPVRDFVRRPRSSGNSTSHHYRQHWLRQQPFLAEHLVHSMVFGLTLTTSVGEAPRWQSHCFCRLRRLDRRLGKGDVWRCWWNSRFYKEPFHSTEFVSRLCLKKHD